MRLSALAGLLLLASTCRAADEYSNLFRQAADFTRQGKYEQAIADYKAALAIRPALRKRSTIWQSFE